MTEKLQGIGANLTVRNEEDRILRQHLENLLLFCDEIVVSVDEGSTDNTYDICREYTDNVFHIQSGDYSAEIRAAVSRRLNTLWELWVDADFIFPTKTRQAIRQAVEENKAVCYEVPNCNLMFGKWFADPRHWFFQKRLFRRDSVRFDRKDMHTWTFEYDGETGRIEQPLLHYGVPSVSFFMETMNRYTDLDVRAFAETGEGGAFGQDFRDMDIDKIALEPMKTFSRYYNTYNYRDEGMHGAIYSWMFALYSFLEKAKVYEMEYKKKKDWQYGEIDADQILQEIESYQAAGKAKINPYQSYRLQRIIRGICPPYLYKLFRG